MIIEGICDVFCKEYEFIERFLEGVSSVGEKPHSGEAPPIRYDPTETRFLGRPASLNTTTNG